VGAGTLDESGAATRSTRRPPKSSTWSRTIPAGCVAGVYGQLKGGLRRQEDGRGDYVSRRPRASPSVGLDEQARWLGHRGSDRPTVTDEKVGLPSVPDFEPTTLDEFKALGHIMTDTHRARMRRRRRPGSGHPNACP